MRRKSPVPPVAIEKAEGAYPVLDPLKRAIVKFQQSEVYREKCIDALEIHDRSMVLDGLDLLTEDYGLPQFDRVRKERLE